MELQKELLETIWQGEKGDIKMPYEDLNRDDLIELLVKTQYQRDELEKKVSEMSIMDEVTNLYNRKVLYNALDYEVKRAIRSQAYLSVLLLGINNFDEIKERYGNEVTNILVRQVANLIKESIRNIDIIGRYSEDEFMIIIPDMNPNKGWVVADRIQRLMDKDIFPIDFRVTLSSGLKHYEGEPVNKLIEITERNLYLSKKEFNRSKI